MKKRLSLLLVIAVMLLSTVMFAACTDFSLGDLFSKNYFNIGDVRKGAEESITAKDGVVTFAVVKDYKGEDGVSYSSKTVKVNFPKNQDLKINAEVEKNSLPEGVRFYITVNALDLDTEEIVTLGGYIDKTSVFPKTILISSLSENFQITSYSFNFGTISGTLEKEASIQLSGIKITAVKSA